MKKFIYVVAFECDGLLAFEHTVIEAESIKDAYDQYDPERGLTDQYKEVKDYKFRNWYVIPLENFSTV